MTRITCRLLSRFSFFGLIGDGKRGGDEEDQLVGPFVTYFPRSSPKHSRIDTTFKEAWNHCSKLMTPASAAARVIGWPSSDVLNLVILVKAWLDLINTSNSLDVRSMVTDVAKEQSARGVLSIVGAKIRTLGDRLKDMSNSNLTPEDRRGFARIALNACQELLNLFDDPDGLLWEMSITASAMLLLLSPLCVDVIKFCHENAISGQLKECKALLLHVLEDYKKECILKRYNYVDVETRWRIGGIDVIKTYNIGHHEIDDLQKEGWAYGIARVITRCSVQDHWDTWYKPYRAPLEAVKRYKNDLRSRYHRKDFDDSIKYIRETLIDIDDPNRSEHREKRFTDNDQKPAERVVTNWIGAVGA